MKTKGAPTMKTVNYFLIALLAALGAALTSAGELPAMSHDGLYLMQDTKVRAVYMKPGADLSEFNEVALAECYVAFRKNWQRDHNRNAIGMTGRVSDKDMKAIRARVADEFRNVFTEVLAADGGHRMVREGGQGVLVIRPAIVNLEVNAPDTKSTAMTRTFSASAGQMTLYMELFDGKTGDIIARIIDPQAASNGSFFQWQNRITNKADARRIMLRWAKLLNDHLAEVKSISAN